MKDTKLMTVFVPLALAGSDGQAFSPSTICQAGVHPIRVLCRNISEGIDFQIATDEVVLQQVPVSASTYTLPAGEADIFILAPFQSLFAIGNGEGKLSIAISELISETVPQAKL